jgi:hypothetical protein
MLGGVLEIMLNSFLEYLLLNGFRINQFGALTIQ